MAACRSHIDQQRSDRAYDGQVAEALANGREFKIVLSELMQKCLARDLVNFKGGSPEFQRDIYHFALKDWKTGSDMKRIDDVLSCALMDRRPQAEASELHSMLMAAAGDMLVVAASLAFDIIHGQAEAEEVGKARLTVTNMLSCLTGLKTQGAEGDKRKALAKWVQSALTVQLLKQRLCVSNASLEDPRFFEELVRASRTESESLPAAEWAWTGPGAPFSTGAPAGE